MKKTTITLIIFLSSISSCKKQSNSINYGNGGGAPSLSVSIDQNSSSTLPLTYENFWFDTLYITASDNNWTAYIWFTSITSTDTIININGIRGNIMVYDYQNNVLFPGAGHGGILLNQGNGTIGGFYNAVSKDEMVSISGYLGDVPYGN